MKSQLMKISLKIRDVLIITFLILSLNAVPFIDNVTDHSFTVPVEAEILTAAAISALVGGIVTVTGVNLGLNYNVNNQNCLDFISMDIYDNNPFVKNYVDSILEPIPPNTPFETIKNVTITYDVINAVSDYLINKFDLQPGSAEYTISHAGSLGYVPGMIFIEGYDLPFYSYDSFGDLNSEDSPLRSRYLATSNYISYSGYLLYEIISSSENSGTINYIMHRYPNGVEGVLESLFGRSLTSPGSFDSEFFYVYCGDSICAARRTNGGWYKNNYQIAFNYGAYNFITGEKGNFKTINSPAWTPCAELMAANYVDTLPITVDEDVLFNEETEDITIDLRDNYVGLTRDDVISVPGDIAVPGDVAIPGDITGDITIPGDIAIPDEGVPLNNKLNLDPLKTSGELLSTRFPFCLPFDLYNAFSEFKNIGGKAPKFDLPIDMGYLGKYEAVIDFNDYTSLANIVKYFIYISFCVGLIIITRKLIGGE